MITENELREIVASSITHDTTHKEIIEMCKQEGAGQKLAEKMAKTFCRNKK